MSYGSKTTALEVLNDKDLSGKYYIVTGGNTGIGFETVRALALKNGHVTIASRSLEKANDAKERILNEMKDAQISVMKLDNSDLKSVDAFAEEYLRKNWPLHCLIMNAGLVSSPQPYSSTGIESTFHVNHLAHFHLGNLLTPKLIESAPSRVVVLSSGAATLTKFKPEDVTWEKLSPKGSNGGITIYSNSKFCNALYAKQFHENVKEKHVSVFSLHPGGIKTELNRNTGWLGSLFNFIFGTFGKSTEQGAATTVYCATEPGIEETNGGMYHADCKLGNPTKFMEDPESARLLWELSEKMIKETHG